MNTPLLNQATLERLLQNVPARRPGESDEVADLALFLCSDTAAYINGALSKILLWMFWCRLRS